MLAVTAEMPGVRGWSDAPGVRARACTDMFTHALQFNAPDRSLSANDENFRSLFLFIFFTLFF